MGKNYQPDAPDAVATANAQAGLNKQTATSQQQLNMVDQINPYGSQTYSQSGSWADGTPKFTQTTTLSPEQQRNYQQQTQFDNLVNQLGINQTQKLTGLLDKPVDLNSAVEGKLFDLGRSRLEPQFARDWGSRESTLMNRGIMPGTEAYTR
jgi:hypothetical protein